MERIFIEVLKMVERFTEIRDQTSDARRQRSGVRGQKSEVRDQSSDVRDQKSVLIKKDDGFFIMEPNILPISVA